MEQQLDVSTLEPPEPMERILDHLAGLPPGDWLRVYHRREPFPLYPLLESLNYRWHTEQKGVGSFEILIWPEHQASPVDPSAC